MYIKHVVGDIQSTGLGNYMAIIILKLDMWNVMLWYVVLHMSTNCVLEGSRVF